MRQPTTREWILGSFAVALAVVWVAYTYGGPSDLLGVQLRATARWSFVLFWLASTGRALATLFGGRFRSLARLTRELGLAFASAQTVHLAFVAWLLHIEPEPFPRVPLIFFSIGSVCLYALVLLSIRRVARQLEPKFLNTLRSIAVEYIALVFLMDFAKNPFKGGVLYAIYYLPFIVLAIAGLVLRRAAALKRMRTSLAELGDVTDYRGAT